MSKVIATSKDRYRATAAERRQYGGSTVTEFYIFRKEDRDDPSKWKIVRGYGPTPGERKTDAIRRSGMLDEPEHNPIEDDDDDDVQELTLDQKRDLLVEEIDAWRDRDPHALPDYYFLRIAHDAGVGLNDEQALLEGNTYELDDDDDRSEIAREFADQVRHANPAQVQQYIDYRDGLIDEE